jgi:Concanavalin A-like lectin/glucanases superfamily
MNNSYNPFSSQYNNSSGLGSSLSRYNPFSSQYNNSSGLGSSLSRLNPFSSQNNGSFSQYNPYSNTGYGNSSFFGANGSQNFMQSNSLISNFAFLLLVIFVFVILLRIGISLLVYFMKPNDSPHLIDGMVVGNQMIIFNQDPSNNGSKTIYRSINANDGIEFTWSTWVFINSIDTTSTDQTPKYKHIFSKGNYTFGDNGMMDPNNAPGLYIAPNTNSLVVVMNTYDVINEEITIPNIPINKWVNVIIRVQNTTLDVYINGTIARSVDLLGVPKQNYGSVYVCANGGFNGYVSNLWYYNYALGTSAIQNLITIGPNTNMIGSNGISDTLFNYLSLRWFFYGAGNGYTPDLSGVSAESSDMM